MVAAREVEPSDASRTTPMGRVRPSSRSTATVSESLSRSIRSPVPRSSTSARARAAPASNTVAVIRTESGPAPIMPPNRTTFAPVLLASSAADAGSAGPRQRRTTTVGGTVLSGPAPSRLRDSTSASPSCHSSSFRSKTSNGATATRFGSRGVREGMRSRRTVNASAATTTAAPATRKRRARGLAPDDAPAVQAVSAAARSAAVAKRSAGLFASALVTARSIASGTLSRTVRMCGIGSLKRFAMTACALEPV